MTLPRLWVVSELYYPEQTSTGYFLTHIAEGLAETMDVWVVCGQPTYSEHGMRAPAREERNGVRIHRVPATHFGKDRLALRAINVLTLSLSAAWFALTHFRRGDRLLIVTNPPTLPPLLGLIARWKRMDAHLLVHDVYPEVLAATGFLRVDSTGYRLLKRFFSATYRLYRSVIVLGRDMADVVRDKIAAGQRITIIPNWGDVDEVQPIARAANPFLSANAIDAPCVIQFSGNIGRTHDVETVLAAARRLRDRADILFVFAGYGGKTGVISDAIAAGELPNVRLLPRQPRELLGPMLASATATIISFVDAMRGLSVPSRMYNVLSAGTPIIAIAEADSELAMVVGEERAGWVLAPGDVDALVRLIEELARPEGAAEAAARGANGRAGVVARYTLASVLDRFSQLIGPAGERPKG
ncbi:glycosyltransferase family 4 protein [Sphingomonas psychrotolerans]|uniref:Glycosyltransferase family 4 protein n=1 Tax=Sphingomonas psychrotolerans TaxID=1327635 RepID=A0ABU3N5B1_9SPHN|nr:glycosyltransferase family 4 protein [Sphingomonas psychrotolerans]MDT8759719.1 glycosyltransferase family 4 protein [Sphingomonas psychrotolerans]